MSEFEEKSLMLTYTLKYHKGKTVDQLSKDVEWLKNISIIGIDHILSYGEKKGYIYSRTKKNSRELYYYASAKGLKKYHKNF